MDGLEGPPPFPVLLGEFDGYMEMRGLAEKTRFSYTYELTYFWCRFAFRTGDVLGQDSSTLASYVLGLTPHGGKRTAATKALKAFYGWLTKRGFYLSDPTGEFHSPRPAETTAPDLSLGDARRLLRAAFRHEKRHGWAIMLALGTGARLQSLANIRREDIHLENPDDPYVYFRVAKGNRPYELGLVRSARIACEHLLELGHDPILGVKGDQFRNWVHSAEQRAGLPRVWPHLLRHHFSHRLSERAVKAGKLEVWRKGMNHADLTQVPRYNHSSREDFFGVMGG